MDSTSNEAETWAAIDYQTVKRQERKKGVGRSYCAKEAHPLLKFGLCFDHAHKLFVRMAGDIISKVFF